MKKLLLLLLLTVFGTGQAYSQMDIKVGVHGGIPAGDVDDFSSFTASVDAAYLLSLADIVEVGPLVGYSHFFGEDDFDDFQFVPIAAAGRLGLPQSIFVGLDLGYAIALEDNWDGGFYYRPQVGYNFLMVALVVSYSGISDDNFNVSSINFGVEFNL